MARLLVSTALAGILFSGVALAQPQDHRGPGGTSELQGHRPDGQAAPAAAPAAPAAAPSAKAVPNWFGNTTPAPAQPAARDDRNRGRDDNRGQQAAPQTQPQNAMRGPDRDNRGGFDNRGRDDNRNAMRGPSRNNFSSYQRNYSAPHRFRAPSYQRPRGWYAHRWTFGEFLPSLFWAPDYWISDYRYYGLMPPPAGTVWVRDGYDALLIDRFDGEIIQVVYDVFY